MGKQRTTNYIKIVRETTNGKNINAHNSIIFKHFRHRICLTIIESYNGSFNIDDWAYCHNSLFSSR